MFPTPVAIPRRVYLEFVVEHSSGCSVRGYSIVRRPCAYATIGCKASWVLLKMRRMCFVVRRKWSQLPPGVAPCPSSDHANHSVLCTLGYRYGRPLPGTPRRSPNQLLQQISDRYEEGRLAKSTCPPLNLVSWGPLCHEGARWFEEVDGGKRH